MKRKRIISLDIDTGTYDEFLAEVIRLGNASQTSYVCHANVHMLIEAWRDKSFAEVVNGAEIVTPDGMPIAVSLNSLYGLDQVRVEGMRMMPDLFAAAEKSGLSVFFYGSTEGVLKGILQRIDREHPQLKIAGAYSPPFRELSESEQEEHVARINASGAQIIFVSLGCPKQEIWMARNKGKINAVMIGVGNAFPVYDGRECRAPQWMQKLSLEWFHRLCQNPRRLWKRYLFTNSIFLWLMLSAHVRKLLSMKSHK